MAANITRPPREGDGAPRRKLSGRVRTLLVLIGGVLLGLAIALVVQSFAISTPLERVAVARDVPAPASPEFLDLVARHTRTGFDGGNRVEILLDGAGTFPRLWEDLRLARRSIDLQLYYCHPGALADSLGDLIAGRARDGVRVRFLYDGFGCGGLGDDYHDRLREAGVHAVRFRPVRWWSLHKAQERSHARIVVIDGAIGYTGGFGVDDRWSAAGVDGIPGWRDTNARFTGPAVAQLHAAFADAWAETTGELLLGPSPSDTVRDTTEVRAAVSIAEADGGDGAPRHAPDAAIPMAAAGLMHAVPDRGSTTAERLLALSIAAARSSLYVANAYFVPDDDFRALLVEAARRGVDVRILTPGDGTDVPLVRYAARSHYADLLEAGIRIWEYRPTMMHAKTFVVDGVWSSIGSMNFDNRSLAVNDETTLLVSDAVLGARMDSIFLGDLRLAAELRPESFARRSRWERVRERFAVLLSRLL